MHQPAFYSIMSHREEIFVSPQGKFPILLLELKKVCKKKLRLGNLHSQRDWGHAKDYVEAMWLMLQRKKPDDYIIGTGILNTVENFAKKAFKYAGLNYKDYVVSDVKFKRTKDNTCRAADNSKAKKILKWKPKINFNNLVEEMVESDLRQISDE